MVMDLGAVYICIIDISVFVRAVLTSLIDRDLEAGEREKGDYYLHRSSHGHRLPL